MPKQVSSDDCKFAYVHNRGNAVVGRSREGKLYIGESTCKLLKC
jgi:hypothetical protein